MSVTVLSPDQSDSTAGQEQLAQQSIPSSSFLSSPHAPTHAGAGAAAESKARPTSSTLVSPHGSPLKVPHQRRANSESSAASSSSPQGTFPNTPSSQPKGRKRLPNQQFDNSGQYVAAKKRSQEQPQRHSDYEQLAKERFGQSTSFHRGANRRSGGGTWRRGSSTTAGAPRKGYSNRKDDLIVKQPKAPNNTSSFLIDDLQQREAMELKGLAPKRDSPEFSCAMPQQRPRSWSSLEASAPTIEDLLNESPEEEDDSEFAAQFDNASMERIESLSREEVNREMMAVERTNRRLYDCVDNLKSENGRLKGLLQQHGITDPKPKNTDGSGNQSRNSSTEEDNSSNSRRRATSQGDGEEECCLASKDHHSDEADENEIENGSR